MSVSVLLKPVTPKKRVKTGSDEPLKGQQGCGIASACWGAAVCVPGRMWTSVNLRVANLTVLGNNSFL
jgi:hypothetical protein